MTTGKFITLEGIDGAGKSTHLGTIGAWIATQGFEVITTREPGGTPLGESLRELLLHHPMSADAEALLMSAARFEHVRTVISPALARGCWVVSDRFVDASYAYQGGGRGVAESHLRHLDHWVTQGIAPDLTLLFDLDPDEAQQRVIRSTPQLDRFEREQTDFFHRVRESYLTRAQAEPDRFHVLDSRQTPEQIRVEIQAVMLRLLP